MAMGKGNAVQLREFGLKHSLMYCRAPVREVNHGLVGDEAIGD